MLQNHLGLKVFSEVCKQFELFTNPIHVDTTHCKTLLTGGPSAHMNYVYDIDTGDITGLEHNLTLLKATKIPMMLLCETESAAPLNAFFEKQGLFCIGSAQSKYMSLQHFTYTPLTQINIKQVTTPEMMDIWRKMAASNFDYPFGSDDLLFKNFTNPGKHHDTVKLFIAYINDKPAGQSMLVLCNDSSANMWSSVLPEYRKQGILTEMISFRNALAKSHGYQQSVVQCMPSSAPIYDKLGYQNAESFNMYIII